MSSSFCCCNIGRSSSTSRYLNFLIYLLLLLTAVARHADAMPTKSRVAPGNCNQRAPRTEPRFYGKCFTEVMSLFCDGSYQQIDMVPTIQNPCNDLTCIVKGCKSQTDTINSKSQTDASNSNSPFAGFVAEKEEDRQAEGYAKDSVPGTQKCERLMSRMSYIEAKEELRNRTQLTEGMHCVKRFEIVCGERSATCPTLKMSCVMEQFRKIYKQPSIQPPKKPPKLETTPPTTARPTTPPWTLHRITLATARPGSHQG